MTLLTPWCCPVNGRCGQLDTRSTRVPEIACSSAKFAEAAERIERVYDGRKTSEPEVRRAQLEGATRAKTLQSVGAVSRSVKK